MVALGVGFFGTNFVWAFHSSSMPLFLKRFTDSKFEISLVLSLAGVMGCIVPPVIGYFSDRTFTRFGRRKPYIFLGMLGVLFCVLSLPRIVAFGIVAAVSALMYLSLASADSMYMALLPDITPTEQRSTASGVMNLFGSLGLICYFVLGSWIWDTHQMATFSMVALLPFGLVLAAILFLREPKLPEERPAAERNPFAYLKGLVQESNALKFFVGQSFWWLGLWVISSFITLFMVEDIGVSEGNSMLVPMAFAVVATIFVLPLGMLGDRVGRKGILMFMVALWAVIDILMYFSRGFTSALVAVGAAGIPYAAVMGVGYAYMLDLVPEGRTAEFVGYNFLSQIAPQILGPLVGGKLIDAMGYRSIFPAGAVFAIIGLVILNFVHPRQETKAVAEVEKQLPL